jgi:serine/threonine-protein kinase
VTPPLPPDGGGKSWRAFRSVLDGKYEVIERIGTGGMGTVVRARDRVADRQVAIKMPHGAGLAPDQLERFLREGQIMASLDHPGIVAVYTCGEAKGRPYLVCELVKGARTLTELRAELPLRRKLEVLRDVARALGHAHRQGVIHRDLKPENILLDAQGRARVTDFGLARAVGMDRLTKTGMHMGTPGYMPPELFVDAKSTGPHTDTWALGAILYEDLAGGRRPYPAQSIPEMARLVRGKADPLPKEVPLALAAIAQRALQAEPEQRYPHGDALADDLDAYLQEPGGAPNAVSASQSQGSAKSSLTPWLLLALLALGAMLAAGAAVLLLT